MASTRRLKASGAVSARKVSTSLGVGGSPVKASEARRSRVVLSAMGAGWSPACSILAKMKRSIGSLAQSADWVWGGSCLTGLTKAQCGL